VLRLVGQSHVRQVRSSTNDSATFENMKVSSVPLIPHNRFIAHPSMLARGTRLQLCDVRQEVIVRGVCH
jgi:hypothetical protein